MNEMKVLCCNKRWVKMKDNEGCKESRQSRIEPRHSQSDRQLSKKPAAAGAAATDTRCSDTRQARRPSDG